MIRKLVSTLVLLCMVPVLFCPVPFAQAESTQIAVYRDMVLAGDVLYILAQDGVWQKNLQEGTESLVISYYDMASTQDVFPSGLFPYGDTFGVVDAERQVIKVWQEGAFQHLVDLEATIQLSDEEGVDYARQGDTLWISDNRQLLAVSLTTGAVKPIRIPGIREITSYPAGGILAIQEVNGTAQVIHIPTTTDYPATLMMLPGDGATGIVYDEATQMVYLVMRGMLNRYEHGEWTPRIPIPDAQGSARCAIWNNHYIRAEGEHLLMRSLDDSDLVTVVIQGGGSVERPDVPFMLEHPAIAIRRTGKPARPEDVYMAVTTGDDTVDLYGMYVSAGFLRLLDKGYLQPIDSDFLLNDTLAMHPVVQDAVMRDGQLYAYPVHMNWVESWWRHLDYPDIKMPATLTELLDFADAWRKEGHDASPVSTNYHKNEMTREAYALYALKQWVLTHGDENLRFSDEDFVKLMERIMTLPVRDEEISVDTRVNGVFDWSGSVRIVTSSGADGSLAPCIAVMNPDEVVVPARLMVYVLNPNSRHKEQAIAFLKYQASSRMPNEHGKLYQIVENSINPLYYEWLAEYQAVLEDAQRALDQGKPEERMELLVHVNQAKWDLQQYEDQIEDYRLYDPEDLSLYQSYYAPRIKIMTTPLLETGDSVFPGLRPHLEELLQQCLEGQLSAETMLQRLDDLWMQYRLEQE